MSEQFIGRYPNDAELTKARRISLRDDADHDDLVWLTSVVPALVEEIRAARAKLAAIEALSAADFEEAWRVKELEGYQYGEDGAGAGALRIRDRRRPPHRGQGEQTAMRRTKIAPKTERASLPTYTELAELVAELTEVNIAGLDHAGPGTWGFVSCFTYGAKVMPPHWQRAIDAREALIENQAIVHQKRRHS